LLRVVKKQSINELTNRILTTPKSQI